MRTIRDVYKIGYGPSSSHTMGPARAAHMFREAYPDADSFSVTLYGSLALTGKGHGTDEALKREFAPLPCQIVFDAKTAPLPHPNTLDLTALKGGKELGRWRMMSIGGGDVLREGETRRLPEEVYPHHSFSAVLDCCAAGGIRLWQYVEEAEGKEIWDYLARVWQAMQNEVREGLAARGVLPGGLNLERKAGYLYRQTHIDESPTTKENRLICSYAYAAAEQNAGGGVVVTAPSCGSCGVLPAVLYYQQEKRGFGDEEILRALAAGGVVGTVIKSNASVSGAECGCQAEIGSACSMAAAALGELFGLSLAEIEYAAEIA
ncbi:MAG: L-serine ammonia-lyase, iron-sulfur-dependent, subunit alpha, partial [Firmicutes bacterium]|nr:L-serine ammonia-lyase, iron-sulfur-dependent, subunit alpha [Bacillota bacterium]